MTSNNDLITDSSTDSADEHRHVALAADMVLFTHDQRGLVRVLLIERGWEPYAGRWALPGGLVDPGETFKQAAARELTEETGLDAPDFMVEIGVFDRLDRDPRGRVISVAYAGWVSRLIEPIAGDDAVAAQWVLVDRLAPDELAFDHAEVLAAALAAFPATQGRR